MPNKTTAQQGFTLLELLVALMMMTLIGLGAHRLLHGVLEARGVQQQHAQRLTQVQKAVWLITDDLAQIDPTSIALPSANNRIQFRRGGWPNPLGLPRGDQVSITYRLENRQLLRSIAIIGQDESAVQRQLLLDNVSDFSMRAFSPLAIEITANVVGLGALRRVVEVPES